MGPSNPGFESRSLWAGIAGPVVFILSWVVAGAMRAGYDPVTDSISELAALDTSNRLIVTFGMIAFGLSAVLFGMGMRRRLGRRAGAALLIAGVSSLGVAAFPCSAGCPGAETSATDTGHLIAAAIHYASFTAVPFLAARGDGAFVIWARWLAGFAALALLSQAAGIGPNGLLQRVGLTLNDAWMVGMAIVAMSESRSLPQPLVTN